MLPSPERLQANREFQRVYKEGESFVEGLVVLYLLRLPEETGRQAGFSVSKKLGNAVVRNRVKRRLRDAYHACLPGLPRGYHAIFVARKAASQAEFEALDRAMRKVLVKARLLERDPND
jgi:ribonuclease P protein component